MIIKSLNSNWTIKLKFSLELKLFRLNMNLSLNQFDLISPLLFVRLQNEWILFPMSRILTFFLKLLKAILYCYISVSPVQSKSYAFQFGGETQQKCIGKVKHKHVDGWMVLLIGNMNVSMYESFHHRPIRFQIPNNFIPLNAPLVILD